MAPANTANSIDAAQNNTNQGCTWATTGMNMGSGTPTTALHPALGSKSTSTSSTSETINNPDHAPSVATATATATTSTATATTALNPETTSNCATSPQAATSDPVSELPDTSKATSGDTGAKDANTNTDSVNRTLPLSSALDLIPLQSHSHDAVPRQTLIKALASVVRDNKPEALPLGASASAMASSSSQPQASGSGTTPVGSASLIPARNQHMRSSSASASKRLADALDNLASSANLNTPLTAFPALRSPCFYHQRFDDAVNIDKVLEEITNDEYMSHSRLVQTATGVREVSKQLQRRPIKRAVRNVMIVTKARDNELVHLTRELATWLMSTPRYGSSLGVNVYVDAKLRNSKRFNAAGILHDNPRFEHMLKYWSPDLCWSQPEKFDLVLTLGGDGTVLFTSWLFQRIVPPVLSFALGSLGFMTTFEFEKYKEHLNRVMGEDGMKINLRMRFTCTVWRAGALPGEMEEGDQFEVLNELVIDRGPSPYVSQLELYGDDDLITVVQADGCIFSTPTGSTAYSLSAGGPLVHPDIPGLLLTPICPHTLSFRPMVLSDSMALRVAVPRNSRATAYCAFDGKGRVELRQGDYVTITASQYPFPTVTRTDSEWFDSVRRTLKWNVRAAEQKPFDATSSATSEVDAEEEKWDIDTDSAYYTSEDGSVAASPVRRQMSILEL